MLLLWKQPVEEMMDHPLVPVGVEEDQAAPLCTTEEEGPPHHQAPHVVRRVQLILRVLKEIERS